MEITVITTLVLAFIALGRIFEHWEFGDDQVIALGRIFERWDFEDD
jgi:hypothetical protein